MDWKLLIERGETTNVEFKAACKWEGEERVRLSKAIVAMANTRDGGTLIIGIDDDRTGGKPKLAGLSPEQLASFDPTKVAEYVSGRFEPDIRLSVEKPIVEAHALVAIVVREFADQPHICVKEARYQEKVHFKPGELLIRTAAAQSTVAGPQELRDLLARAVTKKGDLLLEQVRHIVKGIPPLTLEKHDWRTIYAKELSDWAKIVANMQAKAKYGGWVFSVAPAARPTTDLKHAELKDAVATAAVSLRAWTFPHHEGEKISILADRISCESQFDRFIDRWEFFRSALFGDFRSFLEDTIYLQPKEIPGTELNILEVIYTIAEFLLFAKRLCEAVRYEGGVVLWIQLLGCKGRKLVLTDFMRFFHGTFVCEVESINIERVTHSTDLAAGWEHIATDLVQDAFALFDWNPKRETILEDIAKLRDRKI